MDLVLARIGRPMGVKVNRSKGVHLLTRPVGGVAPDGSVKVTDTVFARARSGHHVIVSPWQGMSFIGPTDTAVDDTPDTVRADASDVQLLLDTVNDTIGPGHDKVTEDDIEATTVGIRPLIVDEAKDSYTTSRRHELYDHAPSGVRNLWSIGGGKWTTGRALGDETVRTLLRSPALAGAGDATIRFAQDGGSRRVRVGRRPAAVLRRDRRRRPTRLDRRRDLAAPGAPVRHRVRRGPRPRRARPAARCTAVVTGPQGPRTARHRRPGRVRGDPRGRPDAVRRDRPPTGARHARQRDARRGRARGRDRRRATRLVGRDDDGGEPSSPSSLPRAPPSSPGGGARVV